MRATLRSTANSRRGAWILALCLMLPTAASAANASLPARPHAESFAAESPGKSFGHRLLLWIPNRVFDVLDVVRLRVRVGPGFSASVRATELADAALGGHAALFAGLPGPRSAPSIAWPLGLESYAGLELSVIEVGSEEDPHGPQYGPLEVGAGAHLLLVGLDLGVDPYDALDLVAGILLLDPKGDDF
jgi:hypothetical protein